MKNFALLTYGVKTVTETWQECKTAFHKREINPKKVL